MSVRELRGGTSAAGLKVLVVASRFNEEITSKLVTGALGALKKAGAKDSDVTLVSVPGAWEIPFALRRLIAEEKFDAAVALGAVIRGETAHFDIVANGSSEGCLRVTEETGVPVGLGILTTEDEAQAEARAGGAMGNKGAEAAMVAVEMATLLPRKQARRRA